MVLNDDTDKYIDDVFSALTITWKRMPKQSVIPLHREFYSKYYAPENLEMFDMAVRMNQKTLDKKSDGKWEFFVKLYRWFETMKSRRVYIWLWKCRKEVILYA